MQDRLRQGIDFFNSGTYFEAHESWEDLWRDTSGKARLFYQGLVQVAVGLHHISGGNARGGRRVLLRGLRNLGMYPDAYAGIDNRRLQRDLEPLLAKDARPVAVRIHTPGTG